MRKGKLAQPSEDQERYELNSPISMPRASAFLWNKEMMLHMNCRGYAVSQFMQPEPAKYAHAPNLEAKTFMQPEQPYYAHHAGRFFYIKDRLEGSLFSAPYEPVRELPDEFLFSAGKHDLRWELIRGKIKVNLKLTLSAYDPHELWTVQVENMSDEQREISLYPYFPVGYMSWMNQSARIAEEFNGIICSSVSPYQKYQEYDRIKTFKDKTFLVADERPRAYETIQEQFEGEGGLHDPDALSGPILKNGESLYETPVCAMQFDWELEPGASKQLRLVFGPARTDAEVAEVYSQYFAVPGAFEALEKEYQDYVSEGDTGLYIETPNPRLDNYVNHWMPRQIFYHGETNRLSTDPQTRNYLQDNMGMSYIRPEVTKQAFITALEQQASSGAMPDGVLIAEGAELKYINQVPHTDHCVWLPVCLRAYLDETNDYDFLDMELGFADGSEKESVAEHMNRAMHWLLKNRDERGLNYIAQGDWCDPMNMVGYKGIGVSGWLTLATAFAIQEWARICDLAGWTDKSEEFNQLAEEVNSKANEHIWNGRWYSRGITDAGVTFGVPEDPEGRIFLNPQAWALLSGAAGPEKKEQILTAVEENLESPYGVEMLAPSFTSMREDVGRVTQKHPGSAENGAVYNHAAAFYIYGLYAAEEGNKAYDLIDKMIPGKDEADLVRRGQLPVFIPNYYRGAYRQFERTAGRSSQLFNTGTIAWICRSILDGLFGLRGEPKGLRISPQLPHAWEKARVRRSFRGAVFDVSYRAVEDISKVEVYVGQKRVEENLIVDFSEGDHLTVEVLLPITCSKTPE